MDYDLPTMKLDAIHLPARLRMITFEPMFLVVSIDCKQPALSNVETTPLPRRGYAPTRRGHAPADAARDARHSTTPASLQSKIEPIHKIRQ